MKGDFSRQTFDRRKHYSGVLMQQGRVQTDADWNEQEQMLRRRTQIEARDVIGRCGGPEGHAGFAISVAGKKLSIGAGRYYVDGILCECEDDTVFAEQPDLPSAPDPLELLQKANATRGLLYLDVWERHITPLDDALLREVALGGPDTATRVKTVWQVRVLPVSGDDAKVAALRKKRTQVQKKIAELQASGGNPEELQTLQAELAKVEAAIAEFATPGCGSPFKEWDELVADPERTLNARAQAPPPPTGPCIVPPTAGYRRLENQLYRVEVHTPGVPGTATFKWSRDNGSVVTSIEKIAGKELTVHDLGPDEVLGFASGQWVELSDDRLELHGLPGQLAQIDAVSASLRRITLKTAPAPLAGGADGVDPALHPKLRRWDQTGSTATAGGVAVTSGWVPLEDGVDVQFSGASFRTGDYWVLPARTATGEIEWPPYAVPNTAPAPQPPRGICHHYCRLALVVFDPEKKEWTVAEDCRKIFPPLTRPCCGKRALHVTGTNWRNDDFLPIAVFVRDGLRMTLDDPAAAASLTNETVLVTLEQPFMVGQTPSQTIFHRVYIRGAISRDAADPRVIVWRPAPAAPTNAGTVGTTTGAAGAATGATGATGATTGAATGAVAGAAGATAGATTVFSGLNLNLASIASPAFAPRATATEVRALRLHVALKGHGVWGENSGRIGTLAHLDGQAFARPGVRQDNTPRIDLVFPSGDRATASDFESWFLIGTAQPAPLQVATVRFLDPNMRSSSAGDVTPPLGADQTVKLTANDAVMVIEITFNRALAEASLGNARQPGIYVEILSSPRVGLRRLPARLVLESPTVARCALPEVLTRGSFTLTCVGTPTNETQTTLAAADDQSASLDGDYDNVAGNDLKIPFVVE
jgi:hypothetical protein